MTIGFINNTYFVGLISGSIVVIDNQTLSTLNIITSPYISGMRDIMFLNNGRTMVVTNINSGNIVFFDQNGNCSSNYTFAYQQSANYIGVHGLTAYNDSYFFTTSYYTNAVYSYTAVENSTSWIERLFINATNIKNTSGGTFMTIDECGRYWFSLAASAVYIFDILGSLIGNFSFGSGSIIDTLIKDNYVMYFSDVGIRRIIRIDPHIAC